MPKPRCIGSENSERKTQCVDGYARRPSRKPHVVQRQRRPSKTDQVGRASEIAAYLVAIGGRIGADAETVLDWADEVGYPGVRASAADVTGNHPGSYWEGRPHIHIPGAGRGGHVPVDPGVTPR